VGRFDASPYLTFTLVLRSTQLWVAPYSEYQQFLYDTITDLRSKGKNFEEIAQFLNAKGYKTTRGKTFRNAHTHSIVKKKRIRDERLNREHMPAIRDFDLVFI
jgi:hypothetical protein